MLDVYRLWRPTPLYRAHRLEQALGTGSRIYYKYEGVSPAGSHKPNTAVPQAFYNAKAGRKRLATETGAGQWGSSLALACQVFGLECKVYMVRVSYEQKPYRRIDDGDVGRRRRPQPVARHQRRPPDPRGQTPTRPGSLGIAISEAVEDAATREDTSYSLGSVLNHVLLHQTVIGQEAQKQLAVAGEYGIDVVIGCVGGGCNFGGLALPFVRDKIAGADIEIVACEPAACPTLTRGPYAYDFGDTGRLTPLVPMHTLGHDFVPPGIHAGGLRYHGAAPIVSQLLLDGLIRAEAYAPDRGVRGRADVRPRGGDHPGAGELPRDQGRDRRRPPRRRGGHRSRRSCSTSPATGTSTWPPTTPTSTASSRTTSCRRPRSSGRCGRSSRCPSRRG